MATDDKSGAAGAQQQGQQQNDSDQQQADLAEKFYTKEQVEEIVGKRVTKLAKTNTDLTARLEALEKSQKPKDGDKDPVKELQAEVKRLKAENAQTKAEKEKAELDRLKIRMAKKANLPAWFDPTLLPGKDAEEVEAALDEILEQMAEAEGEAAEREQADKTKRMKRSFGNKTPRDKGTQITGDEFMNRMMLQKIGRQTPR